MSIENTLISIKKYFSIHYDTDKDTIIQNIREGSNLKGYNIWFLICSSILGAVSIGMNSQAALIAALLMSPFIGPLMGIGLGFGIYNKDILFSSIIQFIISVLATLAISITFFTIIPAGSVTNITEPNLLHVSFAFFGGIAGIISYTKKGIIQILPGAAIAFAILPVITFMGYAIVHLNFYLFLRSYYVFSINSAFVLTATFIIIRMMKIPYKKYRDKSRKLKAKAAITFGWIFFTLPVLAAMYNFSMEYVDSIQAKKFIAEQVDNNSTKVVDWSLIKHENEKVLELFIQGEKVDNRKKDSLNKILTNYIGGAGLSVVHVSDETTGDKISYTQVDQMMIETQRLQRKVDSLLNKPQFGDTAMLMMINTDLRLIYTNFDSLSFSRTMNYEPTPNITIYWKTRRMDNLLNENRIVEYVKEKMRLEKLVIVKPYQQTQPGS